MRIQKATIPTFTLYLTLGELLWLQLAIQNYPGNTADEPEPDREMREELFYLLKEAK